MIFLELFYEFFIIGLFTFGGGYAMIPLVKDAVLKHGWLTEGEFLNMIGVSEVTPGPIAINMATYVGSTQGGLTELGTFGSFLGSLCATLGVVLPAFIIMLVIAMLLKKFMKNKYVQSALKGITPVAIALILSAGITLLMDVLFPVHIVNGAIDYSFNYQSIFIFGLVLINAFFIWRVFNKKLNPITVILSSAVIGIIVCYSMPPIV